MSELNECSEETTFECLSFLRGSRRLIIVIVAIALLLDNMLLTSVVPIIPAFLYQLNHQKLQTREYGGDTSQPVAKETEAYEFLTAPFDNDEKPHFVGHNVPKKETMADLAAPGFTLVPEEHFWAFTDTNEPMENNTLSTPDSHLDISRKQLRHDDLVGESFEIGIMFASKPFVQALTNPFIGPLSNRIGYTIPMFSGFIIMFVTTLLFALGNNYAMLFIARSLQGVGSACTSTAGMGMLASTYPDDDERGNAMAIALGGLALGVLIGPVFGGAMYEFVGKASPFLVIAALALLDGLLQLVVLQPRVLKQPSEGTPILQLLKDPYILVAAGAICFSNLGISVLEPSLPLWMMDTMEATKWQQGVAFLPASISYLIGTNVFGPLGHKIGRWLSGMIGLIIIGVCLLCVPMAKSVDQLIPSNAGIGFAIAHHERIPYLVLWDKRRAWARTKGAVSLGVQPWRITYGTRSRRADSGEVAHTPVTCEVGASHEGVVGEPSDCNVIVNRAFIAQFLCGHLLSNYGEPKDVSVATSQEQTISLRLCKLVKGLINNEFYDSLDIIIKCNIKENALQEEYLDYETVEKKANVENKEVSTTTMQRPIDVYDIAKK